MSVSINVMLSVNGKLYCAILLQCACGVMLNVFYTVFFKLEALKPSTEAEPVLLLCKVHMLRRAPKYQGAPLLSKMI